jgi:hypothetical protein
MAAGWRRRREDGTAVWRRAGGARPASGAVGTLPVQSAGRPTERRFDRARLVEVRCAMDCSRLRAAVSFRRFGTSLAQRGAWRSGAPAAAADASGWCCKRQRGCAGLTPASARQLSLEHGPAAPAHGCAPGNLGPYGTESAPHTAHGSRAQRAHAHGCLALVRDTRRWQKCTSGELNTGYHGFDADTNPRRERCLRRYVFLHRTTT